MTSHFSLNIKTLSAETNAVVLSIALVHFNEKEVLDEIHLGLCTEEQSKASRHIDTKRLHWWFKEFKNNPIIDDMPTYYTPRDAVMMLNNFIVENGTRPRDPHIPYNIIWTRGVQFDWAILENLSHEFKVGLPFRHNAIRDQRTFCDGHVQHRPDKFRSALYDANYHAMQVRRTLHATGQTLK